MWPGKTLSHSLWGSLPAEKKNKYWHSNKCLWSNSKFGQRICSLFHFLDMSIFSSMHFKSHFFLLLKSYFPLYRGIHSLLAHCVLIISSWKSNIYKSSKIVETQSLFAGELSCAMKNLNTRESFLSQYVMQDNESYFFYDTKLLALSPFLNIANLSRHISRAR